MSRFLLDSPSGSGPKQPEVNRVVAASYPCSRRRCLGPKRMCMIMKKNKHSSGQTKRKSTKTTETNKTEKTDRVEEKVASVDDEEQGFGGWLRSTDGIETMKLFVIANTIVMLTTVVYPHIQTAYEIIYDMIYSPDALY